MDSYQIITLITSIVVALIMLIGLIIAKIQLSKSNKTVGMSAYSTLINLDLELSKQSNLIAEKQSEYRLLPQNATKKKRIMKDELEIKNSNFANIANLLVSCIDKGIAKEEDVKNEYWEHVFKELLWNSYFSRINNPETQYPNLYKYCSKWNKEDSA